MQDRRAPIGIFDSGVGGLTVFAAVRRRLPRESLLYLGDTARVPYGTKSAETVVRYARECANFLLDRGVKAIVVACNTASAYALAELSRELSVPVLGVVEPGCVAALEASRSRSIGVIGTTGTVQSNAYGRLLKSMDPDAKVVSRACPLLVPLVEEGWTENEVTEAAVRRYLGGMASEGIDTLILGCTHYPLLARAIADCVGPGVRLVDSAEACAASLERLVEGEGMSAPEDGSGGSHLYVTDLPAKFEAIAHRFLEGRMPAVTRVDL